MSCAFEVFFSALEVFGPGNESPSATIVVLLVLGVVAIKFSKY